MIEKKVSLEENRLLLMSRNFSDKLLDMSSPRIAVLGPENRLLDRFIDAMQVIL